MGSVDQERDESQDKNRSSTKVVEFDLPAKRIQPGASITAHSVVSGLKAIQDGLTKKVWMQSTQHAPPLTTVFMTYMMRKYQPVQTLPSASTYPSSSSNETMRRRLTFHKMPYQKTRCCHPFPTIRRWRIFPRKSVILPWR